VKEMKILIAEDDFTSRVVLQRMLRPYGQCHIADDGKKALEAFRTALQQGSPFNLICLDYLMPEMDGQEVLKEIRSAEKALGISIADKVKIIVITGLMDEDNALASLHELCDAYLDKPVERAGLDDILRGLGLMKGGKT
jgi:two-component system, chemotaxis family, chemotaxis protein CheY